MNNSTLKYASCYGEVLWDNLPSGPRVGGAPLNVCYHLEKCGISSAIISQVGADPSGRKLQDALQELGVNTAYCTTDSQHPTSSVEVEFTNHGDVTYDIVRNVAWDYISYQEEVAQYVRQSEVFVFGSLGARNTVSYTTLLAYLAVANWVVMDINLRAPHYEAAKMATLLKYCATLKLNYEELFVLAEWSAIAGKDEYALMEALFVIYPNLTEIILTKGAEGAIYLSREERYSVAALPITVGDTIGSGDSFLAAFIAGKLSGKKIPICLEEAASLSAYVASQEGACPAYTAETISAFKAQFTGK